MTDENQNTGGETTTERKFGEETKPEVKFGEDDVSKLMKMNSDAQEFIGTLKAETADLRSKVQTMQEELAKSRTIDDLIDTTQQSLYTSDLPESKAPQLDKNELLAELEARMTSNLTQKQQAAQEEANLNTAISLAEEKFGEGYVDYVTNKAKELDISVEAMEQYAKTSPKVFMELLDSGAKSPVSPTTSTYTSPSVRDDVTAHFGKVAKLKDQDTPEGREARREWQDPEFQRRYREHILGGLK